MERAVEAEEGVAAAAGVVVAAEEVAEVVAETAASAQPGAEAGAEAGTGSELGAAGRCERSIETLAEVHSEASAQQGLQMPQSSSS